MGNRYFILLLLAAGYCILSSTLSYAQDTLSVSRVVASAKPSSTIRSTPLQAISSDEFEKMGMRDVYQAVKGFAGVNLRDYGGIGGVKTVSIRGLGTEHTAISYDGIAISDLQSGQIDIGRFSLDNVSLVTLSVGQSDDIFQSARLAASAGTVEIRSMRPVFEDGRNNAGTVSMNFSSFGTYNPSAILNHRFTDRWSLTLSGDYLSSDGDYPFQIVNGTNIENHIRKNGDVERFRCEMNVYGTTERGAEIGAKCNWHNSERGLPGSVILYNEKADERVWDRNWFASFSYLDHFGEKIDFKAMARYSYAWNRYLDISEKYPRGKEDDTYLQNEYYITSVVQYRVSSVLKFSLAEDVAYGIFSSNFPECLYPERWTSQTLFSGQLHTEKVTLTASFLATAIDESVRTGVAAPGRFHISPSVSLSYVLADDIRLRASYKDGYRVPTFNDLYYARIGNTKLKPEKANQFNVGFTVDKLIKVTADTYFSNVTDKIVATPTMFIWKMRNVGKVDIAGVDLSASVCTSIGQKMSLDILASGSYQYAVDVTDPGAKNYKDQIAYTPRVSGSFSCAWNNPWVVVSYLASAVGRRFAGQQNTDANMMDGYIEHNVSLSRDFNLDRGVIRLQGDVNNFTNVMYEVIKYYPMPGRSYTLSLKYKF